MQTKWEYKIVARNRGFSEDKNTKNAYWMVARDWDVDMEKMLPTLGDEGWELVAITSRSGYLGGHSWGVDSSDIAGFTSSEIWVFKRPKN